MSSGRLSENCTAGYPHYSPECCRTTFLDRINFLYNICSDFDWFIKEDLKSYKNLNNHDNLSIHFKNYCLHISPPIQNIDVTNNIIIFSSPEGYDQMSYYRCSLLIFTRWSLIKSNRYRSKKNELLFSKFGTNVQRRNKRN